MLAPAEAAAVIAGGKKSSKGNGKTNAKDTSKNNVATEFADGADKASDVGNYGEAVDKIPSTMSTAASSEEVNTKGRKVLVEYVDGYRSVSKKNVSETEAKKDSTNKSELGYKVIIERPKKDETKIK